LAVLCDDAEWPRDLRHYERAVRTDSRLFPIAGTMAANAWTCAAWAFDPVDPLVRITNNGPANVLLVQNTRDPATPYWGAIAMRVALGSRSRLITVNEGGHAIFAFGMNGCADDITTGFLVTGSLPGRDRFCAADEPPVLAQDQPEAIEAVRDEMFPL
ncbi:MAG: alpha/beta hydrolase, partial [Acidimicrobiales bacterium]